MRHNTVLQRGEGGPFHYVSSGRDGAHPSGGCTSSCDHATREEAYEHHRQWLLDNLRSWDAENEQRRCEECGEWTSRRVDGPAMEPPHVVLCDAHDDRDVVEARHLPPGTKLDSWGS